MAGSKTRKKHIFRFEIVALALLLLTTAIIILFCKEAGGKQQVERVRAESGWTAEDSRDYSLDALPAGSLSLTKNVEETDLTKFDFCTISYSTYIKLYADGELFYDYAPKEKPLAGLSYGNNYHVVKLPPFIKTIRLELEPVFEGEKPRLDHTYFSDGSEYIIALFKMGFPDFLMGLVMILFGVSMVYMGFSGTESENPGRYFSMGEFSILMGLWTFNDTFILHLLSQNSVVVKVVTYIALMFIAYPPVSFMISVTGSKNKVLLPVLASLCSMNFTLTFLLTAMRVSDMHYLVTLTHLNIVVALGMTVYLVVWAIRHKTLDRVYTAILVSGIAAISLGVIADLVRSRAGMGKEYGESLFTRIGTLIFIIIVGTYFIKERNRLLMEKERAETMEKLAYTDGLTGIGNRAAFVKEEKAIEEAKEPCIVMQFDVNFLKTVNDIYGHAAGDTHIIAAADAICTGVGTMGKAFRTGGDEFVALMKKKKESDAAKAVEHMLKKVNEYNEENDPPVELQIAYGYAAYSGSGSISEAELEADKLMYDTKQEMKRKSKIKSMR